MRFWFWNSCGRLWNKKPCALMKKIYIYSIFWRRVRRARVRSGSQIEAHGKDKNKERKRWKSRAYFGFFQLRQRLSFCFTSQGLAFLVQWQVRRRLAVYRVRGALKEGENRNKQSRDEDRHITVLIGSHVLVVKVSLDFKKRRKRKASLIASRPRYI
jgi:hypothetical protein